MIEEKIIWHEIKKDGYPDESELGQPFYCLYDVCGLGNPKYGILYFRKVSVYDKAKKETISNVNGFKAAFWNDPELSDGDVIAWTKLPLFNNLDVMIKV